MIFRLSTTPKTTFVLNTRIEPIRVFAKDDSPHVWILRSKPKTLEPAGIGQTVKFLRSSTLTLLKPWPTGFRRAFQRKARALDGFDEFLGCRRRIFSKASARQKNAPIQNFKARGLENANRGAHNLGPMPSPESKCLCRS